MFNVHFTAALLFGLLTLPLPGFADGLRLVEKGQSRYVIYHAPNAGHDLAPAAAELARLIAASTGATLPVVTEPAEPMICLGDNAASRAAGINAGKMPLEGYRISTRGRNVYLVGHDSPDGQPLPTGGVSHGTDFAVSAFAERVIGVRWLLPGAVGEDIPRHATLTVPDLDVTESPTFLSRSLHDIHDRHADVIQWKRRMKLGRSLQIDHGHAWSDFPPRDVLDRNPDYMAVVGGQPSKPQKSKYGTYDYKFCTTNKGLLDAFAASVGQAFDRKPGVYSLSISPSDASGWCEMPQCQALTVSGHHPVWGDYGGLSFSRTPQMLKFYDDVGRRVARTHPDRMLGGYVYADYTYPPDGATTLSSNVFLVLAARPYYGLTLYKSQYAEEFRKLIAAWAQVSPGLGYYSLDTWMRNFMGAPLGPGRAILKTVYPTLKQHHVKLIHQTGLQAWGYAGLHNYLSARLMWDASADVDALYHDWLQRAYGPGAAAMDKLYTLLDTELAAYERASDDFNYEMNSDLLLKVYLPHFSTIESLYTEAMAAAATGPQKRRLAMFGDNLIVLHTLLRRGGALEQPTASIFYRSDADYTAFRRQNQESLALVYSPSEDHGDRYGGQTKLFIPEPKSLTIPRLPSAPTVDGDLADAAWSSAATAEDFRPMGSADKAVGPTKVYIGFDAANLYVAFACEESNEIRAATTARDNATLYSDDLVQLFFTRPADGKKFWQLAVNAANTQWDAFGGDVKKGLQVRSATRKTENGWTLELAIPLDQLGGPVAGQTWRGNFARTDEPAHAHASWAKVEAGLHEPRNFGAWTFAK